MNHITVLRLGIFVEMLHWAGEPLRVIHQSQGGVMRLWNYTACGVLLLATALLPLRRANALCFCISAALSSDLDITEIP